MLERKLFLSEKENQRQKKYWETENKKQKKNWRKLLRVRKKTNRIEKGESNIAGPVWMHGGTVCHIWTQE